MLIIVLFIKAKNWKLSKYHQHYLSTSEWANKTADQFSHKMKGLPLQISVMSRQL